MHENLNSFMNYVTTPAHLPWLILFYVVWFGGCIGASVVYRRRKGRSLPDLAAEQVLFQERWTSGHSLKSWITQMGGARNVLSVAVTERDVLIWLPFPVNLGFMPEVYDQEHRIPIDSLDEILEKRYWGRRSVRLNWKDQRGRPHGFVLILRHTDAFLSAINEVRTRSKRAAEAGIG